jgi:hypothetical protein
MNTDVGATAGELAVPRRAARHEHADEVPASAPPGVFPAAARQPTVTSLAPAGLLDGAGPGWLRPAPRLLAVRRVEIATAAVTAAGVAAGWGATVSAVVALAVASAALVLGGAWIAWVPRSVRAWAYVLRPEDVAVRRGVLFTRVTVVPYARMQFVDVSAGPWERCFGLATVKLHTAAARSLARIPGLARADADRLRDELVRLAEADLAAL